MFQVRIDVHSARLMATVDDLKEETTLKGLDKENNYGVSSNVTSFILIGGKIFTSRVLALNCLVFQV